MREQLAIQTLLRKKLSEIQESNPRFSLRAYSKKVGIHAGALSCILNGRRNVSRKLAERISARLLLDPQERSEILGLFPEKQSRPREGSDSVEPRYIELTASQFKIVAEWEHFAVLSLMNCEDFKSTTSWISIRLGISESRARQVIERLMQLELVSLNSDGELTRSAKPFRTKDDVADLSLKKCHEQSLDLARESLYRDPVPARDFTSVTMAIDPGKISMAKERIRKFQDELSELLESSHQTEVYRLSMQLFPLSKLNSE